MLQITFIKGGANPHYSRLHYSLTVFSPFLFRVSVLVYTVGWPVVVIVTDAPNSQAKHLKTIKVLLEVR